MGKWIGLFVLLMILSGCRQELPEPEVINAQASEQAQLMKVHHTMQGNSLLIECFVPSISFSPTNGTNEQAKIRLSINGQFHSEYETAAFIVKNVPKGKHRIKLDIVKLDNEPLGMSKQFLVTVE